MATSFAAMCISRAPPCGSVTDVPARPAPLISPMLAALGSLPTAAGWASEFKWDGVRAITYIGAGAVTAMSRNDLGLTSQYPELNALVEPLGGAGFVLDGEIVTLDERRAPDFARLRNPGDRRIPNSFIR